MLAWVNSYVTNGTTTYHTSPPEHPGHSASDGVMSATAHLKSNYLLKHSSSDHNYSMRQQLGTHTCMVGDIQQLEKVQRTAARFVFRDYKYTTSVTGLLERLQWSLLSTRRTNYRLTLFYKAVHDQAGISLHHLQKPLRNTRSAYDTTFIALSARKHPYLFSIFPRTITDWNQLFEQRLKPSVNSFRQSLHCSPTFQ